MKKLQCFRYWREDDVLCFSCCFERMVMLSELSITFQSRISKWSSRTIVLDAFKWGSRKPGYSATHRFKELECPSLAVSLCFEVNYKPRKQNVLKTFWVWAFHASVAAIARGLYEMVKWPEKIDKSKKFLLGHGFNILWDQKTLLTVKITPLPTLPFNGEFLPCIFPKELGHKKC